MRKFVILAATVGLIGSAGLAMAQDHDRGGGPHGGPGGGAPHAGGAQPHPGPAMAGPRPQEHRDAPAMRAAPASPPANAMRANERGERDNRGQHDNAMRGPGPNNAPNNAMRGRDNGPRPDFNRPGDNRPNNAMRGPGPRRDFSSARNFHQNFRSPRRFHAPAYRRPPGWYYQRWSFGQILPALFWAQQYWLNDYMAYDLPPPPPGAVWVRYGNDALLIDRYSGEIITVQYGVFY